MRRSIATLSTVVLSWSAVCALPAVPAAALDDWSVVHSGDQYLVDVSADGRHVLVEDGKDTFRRSVIDRRERTITEMGVHALVLSGDGSKVVFSTPAGLVGSDTDGAWDVYSRSVETGDFALMTPGAPGWSFIFFADVDHTGTTVVAVGTHGMRNTTAPFLGNGVTSRELGVDIDGQADPVNGRGQVWGISADARYVLYSSSRGCDGCFRAYWEDLQTGVRVAQNFLFGRLILSPGGLHLARVGLGDSILQYGRTDNSPLEQLGTGYIGRVAISADGSVVSWTESINNTGGRQDAKRWIAGSGTEVVAVPDSGAAPDGRRDPALVTADGDQILLWTDSNNVFPGAPAGRKIISLRTPRVAATGPGEFVETGPPSAFVPRPPMRILDTRSGLGYAGTGRPGRNSTIELDLAAAGVPPGATAVAVQVAAAEGVDAGYVSVIPTGTPPGMTANLNVQSPGAVVANMAIVPLRAGSASVYTYGSTHLVVDLLGWFDPSSAGGRYAAVEPARILDTRPGSVVNSDGRKPAARETTLIQVTGRGGIPGAGVAAVVLNVAVDQPTAPGYVQAGPADGFVPGASSTLNVDRAGQVVSAATIIPVDSAGRIAIFTQSSAHLVVDVAGFFTAPGATGPAITAITAMFVPLEPVRILDTRPPGVGLVGKLFPGTRLEGHFEGLALVGNVAVTETAGPGYVQLGPNGSMVEGATSSINHSGVDETVSNAFVTTMDEAGLGIFSYEETHLVIDVSGYMRAP